MTKRFETEPDTPGDEIAADAPVAGGDQVYRGDRVARGALLVVDQRVEIGRAHV